MENLAAEGAEEVVNDVEYTHSSSKFTIQGAYDGSRKVVPEPVGLLEYHSANHEPTREEYAQGHPLPRTAEDASKSQFGQDLQFKRKKIMFVL